MKRSMSVLLAADMCSAMLAGCGSTAADTAADASAATEATASSASAEGVNVFKIGGRGSGRSQTEDTVSKVLCTGCFTGLCGNGSQGNLHAPVL